MTDIVKVLRGKYALDYDEKTLDQFCNEAADEIEKLRAALSELVDIVEHALEIKSTEDMDSFTLQPARAALGEKE